MGQGEKGPYDDIIHRPHHVSRTHPQMTRQERAAQFSPFAALTGHEEAIRETERLTDEERELDEDLRADLDRKLRFLTEHLQERPWAAVSYFQPDARKEGGAYRTVEGRVKKIDRYRKLLILEEEPPIPLAQIVELDGPGWEQRMEE